MDLELLAAFNGGLLSGLVVWAISAAIIALIAVVRSRRSRRREVIALVNRARSVAFSAMQQGLFDEAWIMSSEHPLREAKTRYDDLTAQALNLFEPPESEVAFWCAVELYAGWRSPLTSLAEDEVPRAPRQDGIRLLLNGSLWETWELPRPELLARWADVFWPWDRGSARGPAYAAYPAPGDRSRHNIVTPNSDVNMDMLRPYANYLAPPTWSPTPRRRRELQKMFPEDQRPIAATV